MCNGPAFMDLGELRPHEATTPQRVRKSAHMHVRWGAMRSRVVVDPSTTSSSTGTTDCGGPSTWSPMCSGSSAIPVPFWLSDGGHMSHQPCGYRGVHSHAWRDAGSKHEVHLSGLM